MSLVRKLLLHNITKNIMIKLPRILSPYFEAASRFLESDQAFFRPIREHLNASGSSANNVCSSCTLLQRLVGTSQWLQGGGIARFASKPSAQEWGQSGSNIFSWLRSSLTVIEEKIMGPKGSGENIQHCDGGRSHYDCEPFYSNYTNMRRNRVNANDLIEKPALEPLFPDFRGKRVLDLGCGMGGYVVDYMAEAEHVDAVDVSSKMLAHLEDALQKLGRNNVRTVKCSIEEFDYEPDRYDVVISTLAFHYVKDLERAFHAISSSLRKGGVFLFNVEHPVLTATRNVGWEDNEKGGYDHWRFDDYFDRGERSSKWYGMEVKKQHRTFQDYFDLLTAAGFVVERIVEPEPNNAARAASYEMDSHYRRPIFLMMKARKS